ncbi:hypothetical protein T459_31036 [Capsicum annuum]|uniref:Uncharacterized protein n=1 Tax=Capsicum annuum TaxID=4072 RepID=A0A2G2YAM7_CAPAN|nr:hypothetical protein T459_31036 [Capsicum annuum]
MLTLEPFSEDQGRSMVHPSGVYHNQLSYALRVYSPIDSHTCQTPWFVFQDGSDGEPTGQRPERADAEARRRRAMPATIEETAFHEHIESPGFGRPPNPHWSTPRRVIPPDLGSWLERLSAKGSWIPDVRRAIPATTKRVKIQPSLAATSVDVDSHLGQLRARGARESNIRPAITARPVIDVRCEGPTRCMMPRKTWPRPNGFGHNLHSKTRWFTGFCNSHQVSDFTTLFIDARAKISVAESHFCLIKKHRSPRRTPRTGREGQAIDLSIPWCFPLRGFDNDPSAGSPMETLLRFLLPLNDKVQWTSRDVPGIEPPTSPINQIAFLIDADVALAWPAREGADRLKASTTVVCKEHRTWQIGVDEDPMPTASTASENPDRRSWITTSHDEASKAWYTRVAFRFTLRMKCEGRKAIDKT